jgi:hypothetical protein
MQHPAQERSRTAARIGRRLLLVLSLAACGGQADDAGEKADSAPAAPAAGKSQAHAAANGQGPGGPCTPSPAVNPVLLADGAPWQALSRWRDSAHVTFRNTSDQHTVAWVKLCKTCQAVKLQIVSESSTYCNGGGNLRGTTRIAGVWVVLEGSVRPSGWGNKTFSPGDSILVFSHDSSASARLVYPVGNKVQRAPDDAWVFKFCRDNHANTGPNAQWRNGVTGAPAASDGAAQGSEDGPGTYGWMACASGCCQFYIPPNPIVEPEPEPDKAGNEAGSGAPPCVPVPS